MLEFVKTPIPHVPDVTVYAAKNGYYTYTIMCEDRGYSASYKGWNPITPMQWVNESNINLFKDLDAAFLACNQIDMLNQQGEFHS